MFVICDENDVVQDIATEKANLSRGYSYPGYKIYPNIGNTDIRIGDTYKDGVLTKNQQERDKSNLRQQNEQKIAAKARAIAIAECIKDGDLPPDYTES